MFFGEVALGEAEGCLLAHSLDSSAGRVRKGTRLDAALLRALEERGHRRLVVARLGEEDEHEDRAAARVAAALAPACEAAARLRLSRAATGRVNLFAREGGLLLVERDALLAANRVDESITVATLAENTRVAAGRLVATVKIIPFAVAREHVDAVVATLVSSRVPSRRVVSTDDVVARPADPSLSAGGVDRGALALAPYRARRTALVHTMLPALRESVIDKTARITRERLAAREMHLVHESRCAHEPDALARALAEALKSDPELLLVVGASAISDRRDVIPDAIERAGGRVRRFGLPVDPGNLLLVAELGERRVLGLPGCARSPRDNGLDRVLDRIACDAPLSDGWLQSLAVGGLLGEVVERPSPRVSATETPAATEPVSATGRAGSGTGAPEPDGTRTGDSDGDASGTERPVGCRSAPGNVGVNVAAVGDRDGRVAALVLAAGASRRAGTVNKLLYPVAGEPMVRRVARRVGESAVDEVVVVTGHEREAIGQALEGLAVRRVHNPAHASGMASSLTRALASVVDHDAVLVCLADMPGVSAALIERLLASWFAVASSERGRTIVVPVHGGRRGNPVLIGRAFFDLLLALEGDTGARALVRAHPDAVREVIVDDAAVLIDHDTVEELRDLDTA